MPLLSLSDYIDQISSTSKAIRSIVTESEPSPPEFFTNATLQAPLGNLIREADPSEVGLFTLVPPSGYHNPSDNDVQASGKQITRAGLPNATPLKPVTGRTGREGRVKDHEPEIYANAALKYIDRYQSIQSMPRARSQVEYILKQLAAVRQDIDKLSEKIKQSDPIDADVPSVPPQVLIKQEEQKIEDLQIRIVELRKQKDARLAKKKPLFIKPSSSKAKPNPPPPSPPQNAREDSFWNTPGPAQRTMNFTGDLLINENVDLSDISVASFSSPVPLRISATPPASLSPSLKERVDKVPADDDDDKAQVTPVANLASKLPPSSPSSPTPEPLILPKQHPELRPVHKSETHESNGTTPSSSKHQKLRITADTEKIVGKIWTTVGEIIKPGYQTNSGDGKAPRAKETIAILQSLSTKTPNTSSSPTASSLSSFSTTATDPFSDHPTAQQILTAQLLLSLLSSPPNYSISLNKIKETLANSTAGDGDAAGGGGGSTHTRALYACVAKRLIKIERGRGEQVVKFDI